MLRKYVLAALSVIAVLAATAAAQEGTGAGKPATARKHFLIMLKPARPGFVDTPTTAEQKTVGEHFAYLKRLVAEGKVILAGPSINAEKTFGIVVIEAASEAEARTMMEGDPSVKAGVMKSELLPFTLALLRGQ